MRKATIGHIKQVSKGVWKIKLSLGKDPISGKYIQKWWTFRGSPKEADNYFSELKRQYIIGNTAKPQKVKISDFLTQWLSSYAKMRLTPKAYERYQGIVNTKLIPAIGNLNISALRPDYIQKLYSSLSNNGLSPRSVKYVHTVLHKALNSAIKQGLLTSNPADNPELPKPIRAEMKTWNQLELQAFLNEAKKTPYFALFYTALFTGARRSELLALRWQDVDTTLCQISISRTLHMLKNNDFIFSNTKTQKSQRVISLTPSNSMILEAYRKAREFEYKQLDITLKDSDLVFSIYGKPMRPNTVSRAWQIVAQRAGIPIIRFHDARHTHASLMLRQGIHPKIVQERLGHSSIAITLDTYSHVAPGLQAAAAKRFDDIAGIKDNNTTDSTNHVPKLI